MAQYLLDAAPFLLDVPAVLVAGTAVNLTVTGATPLGSVRLLYTEAGPGLTLVGQYGAYCSLEVPILGPIRVADATGAAVFTRLLPAAKPASSSTKSV